MKIVILIGILCCSFNGYCQKDSIPKFETSGEQEDYWAKKTFQAGEKMKYEKYNGVVKKVNATTYKYGSQVINVSGTEAIKQLFSLGFIYPSLIASPSDHIASSPNKEHSLNDTFRADTFYVGNFEELKFLEESPKMKRFTCWVQWKGGLANPLVFLFELESESADKTGNWKDFIKGASLTFFKQGWVII
ncbi:hypothetical protein [Chitinophaga sp. Cy-1792]|uniref:hypothetical protein n=1 Tax=Chitinophaga sp. Cy-1792 TaxID=2608339 RepID=UPI001422C75F|nr:hypothetical protein [Chitinophaga sp. Cy-1792]NIG55542.1 hypothetical protein [Chitinophaga sp. Cy-1792]